jgi:hypothetical protein
MDSARSRTIPRTALDRATSTVTACHRHCVTVTASPSPRHRHRVAATAVRVKPSRTSVCVLNRGADEAPGIVYRRSRRLSPGLVAGAGAGDRGCGAGCLLEGFEGSRGLRCLRGRGRMARTRRKPDRTSRRPARPDRRLLHPHSSQPGPPNAPPGRSAAIRPRRVDQPRRPREGPYPGVQIHRLALVKRRSIRCNSRVAPGWSMCNSGVASNGSGGGVLS